MSEAPSHDADPSTAAVVKERSDRREYVVVARRYRPQIFDELVGQQHVSHALSQAIITNRVGHAYLFTGARGTGKTSAARIFSKALNCVKGPSPTPCNQCDSCVSIASGEDVDVLEIDGASNRGIDEVRQMRANVNIRPSRSRLKIYIIDEVHMLTLAAFNALLKTLEEPPEHVKFIFCTTDPEKVPITVLSRCQRFDFAGIQTESICERLKQIAVSEGANIDDAAITLLARRAAGSMRDSQSMLEQLLAFGGERITEADVHSMLGTAQFGQLAELAACLTKRDAAAALTRLDQAIAAGVDPGQLTEQLLGYFRDMMTVLVGCRADMLLYCTPDDYDDLREAGQQMGLTNVMAVQQILDQTLTRARQSVHVRILVELAIIRICNLEDLDELARLISDLDAGGPGAATGPPKESAAAAPHARQSRSNTPAGSGNPSAVYSSPPSADGAGGVAQVARTNAGSAAGQHDSTTTRADSATAAEGDAGDSGAEAAAVVGTDVPTSSVLLTPENARRIWDETLAAMGDMTAENASRYSRVAVAAPGRLEVIFSGQYTSSKTFCERPERVRQLEQALAEATGGTVRLVFRVEATKSAPARQEKPRMSQRELIRHSSSNPLVRHAMELFDAHVTRVDPPPDKHS